MLKYDLHTHTHFSGCSNLKPEVLLDIAKKRKLDGIAVTDHGTMKGVLNIKKLNKDKDFEVIVGEEITTQYGDVLGYYLNKGIKTRDFHETVDEIRKQGGLVIIPHPFRSSFVPGHKFKLPFSKVKNKIDAIEGFNARSLPGNNQKAIDIAEKLSIPQTGGSDGHFKFEIGHGFTLFNGSLRKALKNMRTKVGGTTLYGPIGGLLSFIKKRI